MYPAGGLAAPSAAYRAYASPPGRSLITAAAQSVLAAAGRTQASTVIPVVRWRSVLSATVTQALVPLNARASPYFPAVDHVAFESVPVRPFPVASAVVTPEPSSNPYAATRPGTATLLTVTVTDADVVVFPAPSRARAVRTWVPFEAATELHATEYGAVAASAPSRLPSRKNWTPDTDTSSDALALTVR